MEIKINRVVRSRRKTIELKILEDTSLVVKAPLFVTDREINKVVQRHRKWIEKNMKTLDMRSRELNKNKFVQGEEFLYLGNVYSLFIVENQNVPLRFDNGFFLSSNMLNEAQKIFVNWYKAAAYDFIPERVEYISKLSGLKYRKVGITGAKKRWGSCSAKGNLNFSYRIIMAPVSVIDYVILHELAHTVEMNHSKRFWKIVEEFMPDYKLRRSWLKEKGYTLTV